MQLLILRSRALICSWQAFGILHFQNAASAGVCERLTFSESCKLGETYSTRYKVIRLYQILKCKGLNMLYEHVMTKAESAARLCHTSQHLQNPVEYCLTELSAYQVMFI